MLPLFTLQVLYDLMCLIRFERMATNKFVIALTATLFMQHFGAYASYSDQSQSNPRFYERKAEGWFWYKQDPEPIEEPEPEPEPEPEVVVAPPPKPEKAPPTPEPSLEAFSSEWFRVNIPKYRDIAIDNPTIENVKAFYYVQRIAMDKSQRFADVAQRAVLGDPYLDETARRPSSTFAAKEADRKAEEETEKLLTELTEKVGFFFFFQSGCEACNLQAQVLEMLRRDIGFSIVPISMDGSGLDTGLFPDYRVDEGQSELMGISKAPALFLMGNDGRYTPIGFTTMSLSDISYRTLLAAIDLGAINEEDFNNSRAIDTSRDLHEVADSVSSEAELLRAADNQNNGAVNLPDSEGFIEPSQLLRAIQNSIEKGE